MSRASRTLALIVLVGLVTACGTAAPSPSPAPSVQQGTPLTAGTYTSTRFEPAVTYTVPAGWLLVADSPTYLQLAPAGTDGLGIHLFRNAVAASQDPTCPTVPEPGVGTTSSELVTWFRQLPGVVASNPTLVTTGGLRGSSLDLAIRADWTQSCPFAGGIPTVPLITFGETGRWVLSGSERLRFTVLDVPGGGTVIVDIDDFFGSQLDTLIQQASPIIRSLDFAAG